MKEVKTFICEVDLYRNGMVFRGFSDRLYDRNTKGSYIVGAKTAKEARTILQKKIGFGSINVPKYQDSFDRTGMPQLKRGQIMRIRKKHIPGENGDAMKIKIWYDTDIKHATAPIERED